MRRYRTGFTLLEVLITISIMATAMGIAAPRIHQTLEREAVRGAKITLATHVARTRGVAASRGCRAVMHVVGGTDARVWVTSCAIAGAAIDTVGTVDWLSDDYGITLTANSDSITFAPTGIITSAGWFVAQLSKGEFVDSLAVSAAGRKLW